MSMDQVRDLHNNEIAADKAQYFMYNAQSKGLSFKTTMGNILTLTPPLTITREQMDQALAILDDSLSEVEGQ